MRRCDRDAPFLAAIRGDRPSRRPLWIMRQAGRYLPEYREMRARMSFLELCTTPAAAAEVTMQPVRRFGMDAAILFTDLLVPVPPMGIGIDYQPGPVLARKVETMEDVEALRVPDPDRDLDTMLQTVRIVREQLADDVALIGFVGAPFTMSCYLHEGRGSKTWDATRRLMFENPEVFDALQERVATCLEPLVGALVEAGCDAIQVFDSWAGVLSSEDWARHCAPQSDRLLQAARDAGALALHFVNGAGQHLERMSLAPADVLAVDWRTPIGEVRRRVPATTAIQGNLDPAALFADEQVLRAKVRAICEAAGERHVFNLGHGVTPQVDPRALEIVAEEVHAS